MPTLFVGADRQLYPSLKFRQLALPAMATFRSVFRRAEHIGGAHYTQPRGAVNTPMKKSLINSNKAVSGVSGTGKLLENWWYFSLLHAADR